MARADYSLINDLKSHLVRPLANSRKYNIAQLKFLRKHILSCRSETMKTTPGCMSFTVLEKQITQMLRFKVKTTPNKSLRTVRKTLECLLFSYHDIYIIFFSFFPLQYFYYVVVLPVYMAERFSSENVFWFFLQRWNKLRSNKAINPLIKYNLRFLTHRPRFFVARSVRRKMDNELFSICLLVKISIR